MRELIILSGVIILIATFGLISRKIDKKQSKIRERERSEQERLHTERVERQKLDHQKNVGRKVFNKLRELYGEHETLGLRISRIEENGKSYSIFVQLCQDYMQALPVMQISICYTEEDTRVSGHIFYGAYGPDIWFNAEDHLVVATLNKLVIPFIETEVARLKANSVAN